MALLESEPAESRVKRVYLFFRGDGLWYPVELAPEAVAANVKCNPGTVRVEDIEAGTIVWPPEQAGQPGTKLPHRPL